ncbi:MAG: hypothetical protein GF311_09480 [Candidatus Lokiarchaeota archaeon]|nr:hypothetical protein [Candidatus Lokiarchaeota archaeon]
MPANKIEEVIFYLDLTKNYVKKKDLLKLLENYIEKRNEINRDVEYGVLLFDNEDSPIFASQKNKSVGIQTIIDENWESRSVSKSFFENGLFYILSYITESIRKHPKAYRIIILSDTPSGLSEDYQKSLFDIISKVKYFPTFIDIIRLSKEKKRFFTDEVKLNILVSDTKGGIFYVKDKKELTSTFNKLINPKDLVNTFRDKPDQIEISNEDLMFYINLAKSLKDPSNKENLVCYLCNNEICPVCADVYDIPMKCTDCGSAFHNCCVLDYSIDNNIGIPFIFRCPKCGRLLKLQKEDIKMHNRKINQEDQITENDSIKKNQQRVKLDKVKPPEPLKFKKWEKEGQDGIIDEKDERNVKYIQIGGFFGKTYKVIEKEGKMVYEKLLKTSRPNNKKSASESHFEHIKTGNIASSESLNDPSKQKQTRYWKPNHENDIFQTNNTNRKKLKLCPICGKSLPNGVDRCLYCGNKN